MITNIDIDDDVVAEAMKVSGARTKREVVDRALREMVARAHRPRFRDFAGIGDIDPLYDPKAPDALGGRLGGGLRVEEDRVPYVVTPLPLEVPAKAPTARKKAVKRKR